MRRAVHSAVNRHGRLEPLVNNAGIATVGGIEDSHDDEWGHALDANVLGLIRMTRASLSALRRSRCPAIITVASIAATARVPARAVYSATKGALTLALTADLIPEGIRVNAVTPGTADTRSVARLLAKAADPVSERASLEARQPHGWLGKPDEVAAAIAFLASQASASTTRTTLAIDGRFARWRLRPRT